MAHTIPDDHILDAAIMVIAQHGYEGATTRQIAAAANINEVTLFRRFGSKEKLLKAALEHQAEHFGAAGIEYTGDIEADFIRVVQFYQNVMQHRGRIIPMLLAEIPRQPELLELMQTPRSMIKNVLELIERYQQEGILIEEPPSQAFAALLGAVFLGGMVGAIYPDLLTVAFNAREYVQNYLRGRVREGTI
jgi:AcrR family transcriptional regulator